MYLSVASSRGCMCTFHIGKLLYVVLCAINSVLIQIKIVQVRIATIHVLIGCVLYNKIQSSKILHEMY